MRRVVRTPNHLGDTIMALPAIAALARMGPLEVHGPRWVPELTRGLDVEVGPVQRLSRDVDEVVLMAPSFRAAWQSRRARRRIGTPTDARGWLLSVRVPPVEGHRRLTYAALAAVAGARTQGRPVLHADRGVPGVPEGHVGLNPVVAGGVTREWRGFRALADRLDRPVVFYAGPGEEAAVAKIAGPHPIRAGLPLAAFGLALTRCALFVSNDAGAAHAAAAYGARVLVIYSSTVPEHTGPDSALALLGPRVPCAPCYRNRCPYQLECLQIPVSQVLDAVRAHL